ncbi:hypothetical protein [Haliangium ochraceum]|uniref:Uncharacterized protein n=1 Tax=Haliangium ochraceum (strain DSM 14365 / JCM 11303 / SMP-2) TaxID=502025 RepID=D0LP74_HALO1|nr:hypothetical protein [Haliangium ochraceum]ACY13439.1 hypothetical protein Hoch_0824 [Haliangium ochraceum DSM 14365]
MTTPQISEADIRATYRFLAHEDRGVTELRIIGTKRGDVRIGYFSSEDAFARACLEANGTGQVYVGIQPRPEKFLTQSDNRLRRLKRGARDSRIEHITSVVIDIDPVRAKNTASTDEELGRAVACGDRISDWVAGEGCARPVRNMSGNGCQLWFAVPPIALTAENRDEMRDRLKAFEAGIRERFQGDGVAIDSIYNFSRIIKVIGSLSIKGEPSAERPHRLSRSLDAFERREDAALLEMITMMRLPEKPSASAAGTPVGSDAASITIAPTLSPRLQGLLSTKTRIRGLFEGRGKTAIGSNGQPLDTSSSGYDYSLALKLALLGAKEPSELATALWHRPDGHARAKGEGYIQRTVARALEVARADRKQPPPPQASSGDERLPEIQVNGRQVIDVIDDAWSAIRAANEPPVVFLRRSTLVRLQALVEPPTIEEMDKGVSYGHLCRVARWVQVYENRMCHASPRADVARDVVINPDPKLPRLESIVMTPVFDARGGLLTEPGYHRSARLWYHKAEDFEIPTVPAEPSLDDVMAARSLLINDLFFDFPFVGEADQAHAIAALLLPFARRLIDGCTPLHLLKAPIWGTGKSLLGQILVRFAMMGKKPAVVPLAKQEDEVRKGITAALKAGHPVVQLDNVESLESENLARVLTTPVWRDRNLGESRMIDVPNRVMWIATGNNPLVTKEIARRILLIELQPRNEQPWLRARSSFKHQDLLAWVEEHRGELIWACLVLIQAWVAAGRPRSKHTLGSFEEWASVMGGILENAEIYGFLGNLPRLYSEANEEGEEWQAFVEAWWARFQAQPVLVQELVELVLDQKLLTQVVLDERSQRAQRAQLGRALAKVRNRIIDGRQIHATWDAKVKRRIYKLVPLEVQRELPLASA